ncbi:SET and MYND domain-containing protein DDB_G0273589-like [Contarinia nasturtii]|uniref:SET and MYND domain-containing protein DDB_G0273589-like n=1 Tax=Contarinia nasturtii TaxID=265458 RepID=UPI0012D47D45|nr:SET and MYND domain-containing protein DDB_G0273589-like [Contarinia nasturtii]
MERIRNFLWPRSAAEYIDLVEQPVEDPTAIIWKTDEVGEYVDICGSLIEVNEFNEEFQELIEKPVEKNNKLSTMKRRFGNLVLCPYAALDFHNESLRYAEIGSIHVALAYANRASCFFELELYDQMAVNIVLATSDETFPKYLLPKIMELKKTADSIKKNVGQEETYEEAFAAWVKRAIGREPQLSYLASKKHPCLADVVEIKESAQYGRYIVSKYELPADQIILIEEYYLNAADVKKLRSCATCSKEDNNFIACEHCTGAMFCDKTCQNRNELHKWECNTFITSIYNRARTIIYSILLAIEAYTENGRINVNELMEYVKEMLDKRKNGTDKLPESTLDSKSKYQFFLKLAICDLQSELKETFTSLIYVTFSLLMSVPKIEAAFKSEKERNFLMHLIGHHILVISTNAFGDEDKLSLGLIESLFNHSCKPNIDRKQFLNKQYYFIANKVGKGVQLFISYLNTEALKTSSTNRRQILFRGFGFICNCIICAPKVPTIFDKCNRKVFNILVNRFCTQEEINEIHELL